MPVLHLLRHAKSDWDSGVDADHERPLARRGERAAVEIADHLRSEGVAPDLVLCSTARRAQQTWAIVADAFPTPPEVRIEPAIYLAEAATLLELVRAVPATAHEVLLVGHNPGFHDLAVSLVGRGDPDLVERLTAKFPTAAVASLAFDGSWDRVRRGSGKLERFVRPRDLRR